MITTTKPPSARTITARQLEVWRLIAMGKSTKECAADLGLSMKTIDHHRSAINASFGFKNSTDLTRGAVAHGVITIERDPVEIYITPVSLRTQRRRALRAK